MMLRKFQKRLAYEALRRGESPETFEKAANGWAYRFWFALVVFIAVWFFAGWAWALIPAGFGIFCFVQAMAAQAVSDELSR